MRLLIVLSLLFSVNIFAKESACDVYQRQLEKEFKGSIPKETATKDEVIVVTLKNKKEYDKMKKMVQKIPLTTKSFEPYLKAINDEKYELTDVGDNFGGIYRETCLFSEYKGVVALLNYVKENKQDKKLVEDFQKFLMPRIEVLKNSPILIPLIIRATYARDLAEIKHGEESDIYKQLQKLNKDANNQSKEFNEETSRLYKNKKDEEYTADEIKPMVMVARKEAKASKEYSDQLFELLLKL